MRVVRVEARTVHSTQDPRHSAIEGRARRGGALYRKEPFARWTHGDGF